MDICFMRICALFTIKIPKKDGTKYTLQCHFSVATRFQDRSTFTAETKHQLYENDI